MSRPRQLSQMERSLGAMFLVALALAGRPVPVRADEQRQDPREFYAKVCGRCHETGIGPVITGRDLPPEYYVLTARHGRNAMPAFRLTDIDDRALEDLARYLAASPRTQK